MNTDQLITFIKVAETESFSKASKDLYLTAQSVTQQIDKLEDELGFRLFNRTRKGATLTTAGKQYYQDTVHVVKLLDINRKRALAIAGGKDAVTFCHYRSAIVTSIGNRLRELHPDIYQNHVQFNDDLQASVKSLEEGMFDFLEWIIGPYISYQDLKFTPLAVAHPIVFISHEHPLASAQSVSLEDLDGYKLWLTDPTWFSKDFLRDLSSKAPSANLRAAKISETDQIDICLRGEALIDFDITNPVDAPSLVKVALPAEYDSPYGLLHNMEPTPSARTALEVATSMYHVNG